MAGEFIQLFCNSIINKLSKVWTSKTWIKHLSKYVKFIMLS